MIALLLLVAAAAHDVVAAGAASTPEVLLDAAALAVPAGGRASYSVRLSSAPAGPLWVVPVPPDPAQLHVHPSLAQFSPDDWQTPRELWAHAALDASPGLLLQHQVVAAGAPAWGPELEVAVAVAAGDAPGLLLSARTLQVPDGGGAADYVVALESRPAAAVTVHVRDACLDGAEHASNVLVEPAAVVFEPGDWARPRHVTVRAAPSWTCAFTRCPATTHVLAHAVESSDARYDGLDRFAACAGGADTAGRHPHAHSYSHSESAGEVVVVVPGLGSGGGSGGGGPSGGGGHREL